MKISRMQPKGLNQPPTYSHTVTLDGPARLVYVSGQVSYDRDGKVVGAGDMKAQSEQVFANVTHALRAAGADWGDIIKMNGYMVGMNATSVAEYRSVRGRYLKPGQLPASTLVGVDRLVEEALLLEVEVIAAVAAAPEKPARKASKKAAKKR